MLQSFLIYANFSRLFLSALLYDLSANLQAERLAFRLYDALKICGTIVPQLSKCLKFEAVWGVLTDQMI